MLQVISEMNDTLMGETELDVASYGENEYKIYQLPLSKVKEEAGHVGGGGGGGERNNYLEIAIRGI